MSTPSPTLIRGVLYASQREAGRALGISGTCISKALDRGDPDSAGICDRMCKPVAIKANSREYKSIKAAAIKHNLRPRATAEAIRRARLKGEDYIVYKGVLLEW